MKKNLILLLLLISIIFLVYMSLEGIKVGKFELLSVSKLIEKNDELEERIATASLLSTVDYAETEKKLEKSYEDYKIQKQTYEDLIRVTGETGSNIYETKQYDIGYLWKVLGDYAKKRNVNLGINVQKNITSESSYNINFTVSGKYVNISQFITDVENNSDLYFRIYNFRMHGEGEGVVATFIVKNVDLDSSTVSSK